MRTPLTQMPSSPPCCRAATVSSIRWSTRSSTGRNRFLILHNDNAVNFTLAEAPGRQPRRAATLIDHRDDVRLDAVDALRRPPGGQLPRRGVAPNPAMAHQR